MYAFVQHEKYAICHGKTWCQNHFDLEAKMIYLIGIFIVTNNYFRTRLVLFTRWKMHAFPTLLFPGCWVPMENLMGGKSPIIHWDPVSHWIRGWGCILYSQAGIGLRIRVSSIAISTWRTHRLRYYLPFVLIISLIRYSGLARYWH